MEVFLCRLNQSIQQIKNKSLIRIKKEDNEQVFMLDEETKMLKYLEENQDLINLGLLLLFKTGLRIGELTSLNKEDMETSCLEDLLLWRRL